MKFKIFVTTIGVLCSLNLHAIWVPGEIVRDSTTETVSFRISQSISTSRIDFMGLQTSVIYRNSAGEKKVLLPNEAIAIKFTVDKKEYTMLSLPHIVGVHPETGFFSDGRYLNSLGNLILSDGIQFIKLDREQEVKGTKFDYFAYYYLSNNYGQPNRYVPRTYFLVRVDGGTLMPVTSSQFKKIMQKVHKKK